MSFYQEENGSESNGRKPIMPVCLPIAKEGYPFVAIALLIAIAIIYFVGYWASIALFLPAFVINFFRNPERVLPEDPNLIVSPADGTILSVGEVDEKRYLNNRRMKRVCIFMSVFNVHVNRIPFSGKIKWVKYNPGKFLMAFSEKTSLDNEQNAILIDASRSREILFIQIAGLIARRIVCYVKGGEEVIRGERFGLIRFGSRVDIYMPLDTQILVKPGEKTKAGETAIARLL